MALRIRARTEVTLVMSSEQNGAGGKEGIVRNDSELVLLTEPVH